MSLTFQCPACKATHSASWVVAGRRIRCPTCDQLVEIPKDAAETVADESLSAFDSERRPEVAGRAQPGGEGTRTVRMGPESRLAADETVMLEAVPLDLPAAVEVSEPLDEAPPVVEPPPPVAAPQPIEALGVLPERVSRRKPQLEDTQLDMTPMVDVVFQLLIFFMLTAAFALQKSLTLPKPPDEDPAQTVIQKSVEDSPEFVIVRVDEFNTFHVLTVDWEEEAPSVQDLHIRLRRAREGNSDGTIPTKLLVEAAGDAAHGRVVAALDAGTATGFEEVQLTTREDD